MHTNQQAFEINEAYYAEQARQNLPQNYSIQPSAPTTKARTLEDVYGILVDIYGILRKIEQGINNPAR